MDVRMINGFFPLQKEDIMLIQPTLFLSLHDQFFHFFGKLSDSIMVVNRAGMVVYLNPGAESLFRVGCNEWAGRSVHIFISDYKMDDHQSRSVFIGIRENKQHFSLQIQSNSLSIEEELYNVMLLTDLQEILSKDDHMKTLSKELADIKLALDSSTIVAITNEKGIITWINDKFCELSKYREEELIGQNHRILNSGYHSKVFFREMWKTISRGEIWKGEIQNKAKDGSLYWVDTTIVPFLSDDGKPYQYVSIRTDITKRVQMEIELQEAMKMDFNATMKNLQNGIFKMKKDENGCFIYTMAEGKLLDEIGYNSKILVNNTPHDVYPNEIAELKRAHYKEAFEGQRVYYEIELNGRLLYVDVTPVTHEGTVVEIVGSVHDMTELRLTQKELLVNQLQYQSLFEYSQDFVVTFDSKGHVIDMNPTALEFYGFQREKISKLTMGNLISNNYKDMWENLFLKAVLGNPQNSEIEINNKQGTNKFINVILLPIILDNQIKGVYSIGKDITEQKKIQETNAYLAHHDELTKLPNRRWIEQKLRESISMSEQEDQKLAVLFIDLDRFKYINDSLGHIVGDRLLEQISDRLLESIDTGKQHAARISGDEFMVLCTNMNKQEEAVDIARTILQNLTTPIHIADFELFVTASIGISFYPSAGTTVMDLMKKADIALYKAKEGRNMYQIYDQSMDERDYNSFVLERDLRKAILNDEFIVHLQPRVDAKTGKTIAAEALVRWMHPQIGLIPPGEFIPLAEESGLILSLGKLVKKRVCEQLAAWKKEGITLIPISVNISSKRFLQREFSQEVRRLLTEYDIEGKWLEIEITENSLMKNEEYILQTLHELKEMGIKIYIDDFGTGYSSFNYLKSFKLDGVKIDRSFICNISEDSENAGITTAMIKMAQHLKMEVIAEGVETETELAFLLDHECHHVQGYYFGKPCSIEEFEKRYMQGDGSLASTSLDQYAY